MEQTPAPVQPMPMQGQPPPQQGYDPNQQGYPPQQQGYPPQQQGYPPQQQGYQQPGYPPQQPMMAPQTNNNNNNNTTVIAMNMGGSQAIAFGPSPVPTKCASCGKDVNTCVDRQCSCAWICAVILIILFWWNPFWWCIFCICLAGNPHAYWVHTCPMCNYRIAKVPAH